MEECSRVPTVNSFNALEAQVTDGQSDDGEEEPNMPNLMEVDERGNVKICEKDVSTSKAIEVSSKKKDIYAGGYYYRGFRKGLIFGEVFSINSILKKTNQPKPVGSKFGPIALYARLEDNPNK